MSTNRLMTRRTRHWLALHAQRDAVPSWQGWTRRRGTARSSCRAGRHRAGRPSGRRRVALVQAVAVGQHPSRGPETRPAPYDGGVRQ
jgi:hypothetical protein